MIYALVALGVVVVLLGAFLAWDRLTGQPQWTPTSYHADEAPR